MPTLLLDVHTHSSFQVFEFHVKTQFWMHSISHNGCIEGGRILLPSIITQYITIKQLIFFDLIYTICIYIFVFYYYIPITIYFLIYKLYLSTHNTTYRLINSHYICMIVHTIYIMLIKRDHKCIKRWNIPSRTIIPFVILLALVHLSSTTSYDIVFFLIRFHLNQMHHNQSLHCLDNKDLIGSCAKQRCWMWDAM